ncbi:MAG: hypothetical protein JW770_05520 [Actinobacteria bacterium]|nr:hypothetical protein [Actinomycetota bacterium]
MKLKKGIIIALPVLFCIPAILCSCFITDLFTGGDAAPDAASGQQLTGESEGHTARLTEEQFNALLENEDFLGTFNAFYYPGSDIKEARVVESEGSMLYVILETSDVYDTVIEHYENKKVQSIWSRDFIFQKSMDEVEEEFTDDADEGNTSVSRYTYSSKDRNKVVDVLLKDLGAERTQIMITYWSLQDSF